MVGKYMYRGIWLLLLGVSLNLLGYYLMEGDEFKYGWAMIMGTIAFGVGFIMIVYGLIRRIDRKAILEDRSAGNEKK
jgi:formate/nitrite transporter FocA (FNT family)